MLKKLFLIALLSLSVSCFADSNGNKSKSLMDSNQQIPSLSDSKQQKQAPQQGSSEQKEDHQSSQGSNPPKKPSMIEYCREHTC